jgi:hypothetical protein
MQLRELTKQEVWDLPLSDIHSCNKSWEEAIKKHDSNWLLESLKDKPITIEKFILSRQDYKLLHYQFQWCQMSGSERMVDKFKERTYEKTKSHGYYDGGDHSDTEFLDMYYGKSE